MEKNTLEIKNKLKVIKIQCKPTDTWQTYLDDGDDMGAFYTEEGIIEVSKALDHFIESLLEMNDYSNNKSIIQIINRLILDLNNISHEYEGMIETYEREELVDFIHSVLDTIEYDYDCDITERWREW